MRSCNEEEIDQLRAQLAAVTAERDEAWRNIEEEAAFVALKAAIERAEKAEAELAVWRKWADEIDEDNGNPKGSLKDSIAREATDAARKGTT